jgi:FSR family fosmidomycin resistance protein-like MFS transporter
VVRDPAVRARDLDVPPGRGQAARQDAGDRAAAMSLFAAGGSVGFFLAPALATPALIALGLRATALFLPPAALIPPDRERRPGSPSASASASAAWPRRCSR